MVLQQPNRYSYRFFFLVQTAEILVYAYDPSDRGAQPNGKQRISAIDNPGGDT